MSISPLLRLLGACKVAVDWGSQFSSLQEAWSVCERANWMTWLLVRVDGVDEIVLLELCIAFAENTKGDVSDSQIDGAIIAAKQMASTPSDLHRRIAKDAAARAFASFVSYASQGKQLAKYSALTAYYAAHAAAFLKERPLNAADSAWVSSCVNKQLSMKNAQVIRQLLPDITPYETSLRYHSFPS